MTDNNREIRSMAARELRAVPATDGKPATIEGTAAVFNLLSDDLGGFREQIAPGAFATSLIQDDIRALLNHNADYVLGRNRSGTLRLWEDDQGLQFSLDVPDTQAGRDLVTSMQRGDISQMSFGFETLADDWLQVSGEVTRTLLTCRLWEISPVTFPAYPQTSASVRAHINQLADNATAQAGGEAALEASGAQARKARMQRRLEIAEREI